MKLATIEVIDAVTPHPNADRLDMVTVLGYQCVVPKDSAKMGDYCVFIKPDTVLPDDEWAASFKKFSKTRVKAMRLRGEWSMGIALPIPKSSPCYKSSTGDLTIFIYPALYAFPGNGYDLGGVKSGVSYSRRIPEDGLIGYDVSDLLGITKYDPPAPQNLEAKSSVLPHGLGKTDEENWQTFLRGKETLFGQEVCVTQKIDGSSTTFYCCLGEDGDVSVGITSRSQDLKLEAENNYTRVEKKYDALNKLRDFCVQHGVSLAVRGEMYGNGIQKGDHNPHSKLPLDFAAFSVYNLGERCYERQGSAFHVETVAQQIGVPTVPVLERGTLTQDLINKWDTRPSLDDGSLFEGVVVEGVNFSFKVINKEYDSRK